MENIIDNLPPLFKDKIQPVWHNLDKSLYENNRFTNALAKLEDITKVNRKILLLGIIIFTAVYLIFGYGAHFFCNILGFVYPAYASFKAIESQGRDDDTQWLTYWVVYAAFSVVESFTDIILYWVPFYYLIKCVFLLYLYHPSTFAAKMLYKKFLRPYLVKYQNTVDRTMNKANKLAEKITDEAKTSVNSYSDALHEVRNKGD